MVQDDVLNCLTAQPRTTHQLARAMHTPVDKVRDTIHDLKQAGKIKVVCYNYDVYRHGPAGGAREPIWGVA